MKIWAHTLVKNEAKWLWYAVTSVVDYLDKILLWDTGSTDGTLEVIEDLCSRYGSKIDFREYGPVDAETYTVARKEMLEQTESDWFLMLDGDEIWFEDSIQKVISEVKTNGNKLESVIVPTINLVGDIFHYQEASAGKYKIAGKEGHLSLKAINMRIPGLQIIGPHGQMGWADGERKMIQDRDPKKIKYLDAPFFHTTHLQRSGIKEKDAEVVKRKMKLKHEIGIEFPKDYMFPEAFFVPRPDFILSPWQVMSPEFKLRASIETPLRKVKRRIWRGGVGY
jgi:glycosyltransferase involved in cell wall biosynthesis